MNRKSFENIRVGDEVVIRSQYGNHWFVVKVSKVSKTTFAAAGYVLKKEDGRQWAAGSRVYRAQAYVATPELKERLETEAVVRALKGRAKEMLSRVYLSDSAVALKDLIAALEPHVRK